MKYLAFLFAFLVLLASSVESRAAKPAACVCQVCSCGADCKCDFRGCRCTKCGVSKSAQTQVPNPAVPAPSVTIQPSAPALYYRVWVGPFGRTHVIYYWR